MIFFTIIPALVLIAILLLNERVETDLRYTAGNGFEISFTLLHITFKNIRTKKRNEQHGFNFYRLLIAKILDVFSASSVTIKALEISVPLTDTEEHRRYYLQYRYHTAICALLAYFEKKSKKLVIKDNAIILIPDANEMLKLHLTLSLKLFHILRAYSDLKYKSIKEKKTRRQSNVGN